MADGTSHLEEKFGPTVYNTNWGKWYQTLSEIHIEVYIPVGTRPKQLTVNIRPSSIKVGLGDHIYFEGRLYGIVHGDDSTWTIEEKKLLRIVLPKADYSSTNVVLWTSLLADQYPLDETQLTKTKEKLDLERFQIENAGINFSKFKALEK